MVQLESIRQMSRQVSRGSPGEYQAEERAGVARLSWPQVRSLGWEDPLEEKMAIHSSILAWRIPMDRGIWWAAVDRVTKSKTSIGN